MSYTPTNWKTGDVITAEKLNNMEQGIVGSAKVLFVELNTETGALNKTWNEINNALSGGDLCLTFVLGGSATSIILITATVMETDVETQYSVYFNFETPQNFTMLGVAETPDGYPTLGGK